MPKPIQLALLFSALLFATATPAAQPKEMEVLHGPATAKLGTVSQIEIPAGFAFLDGEMTRALMKASGEPTSGNELGFLRPTNGEWSVIFEFSDIGYVKDDDKDKLDAPKLLKSYQDGTAQQNKAREAAGNPPLLIVGWEQEPKYDSETHNLTWAIRATSGGEPLLNYNTRLLGRKGVMEVVLICDPKDLPTTLPEFKTLLTHHKFATGESYAEYRPGDKIAKYGLGALVLGVAREVGHVQRQRRPEANHAGQGHREERPERAARKSRRRPGAAEDRPEAVGAADRPHQQHCRHHQHKGSGEVFDAPH